MCSVTSQGHPHARFRRALSAGNPRLAEAAARDLHHVSLADALELCLLYRGEPERYERAAARWIARLIAERPEVRLAEVELAAAGFREAVHSDRGVVALRDCLAASTRAAAL
jgi:predicted deacetylase